MFPIELKGIWRKDFHSYVTRKQNISAVREDQVKLKVDGEEFAVCSYCKGSGTKQDDSKVATPDTFKRRAYWLKNDPKFILVHYLDEGNVPIVTSSSARRFEHEFVEEDP